MLVDDWTKKYFRALQEVSESIRFCRTFITGLNANIDALKHVEGKEVERVISERGLESEIQNGLVRPPREIKTFSDVLAGILFCAERGQGEEWFIWNSEITEMIRSVFGYDRLRMGGQCGIMTNVLALLNLRVIPNVVALPRIQAERFTTKGGEIIIPRWEGNRIVFKKPLEAVREKDKALIHWIFEFDDEFTVKLNGETVKAPVENRFIATFDDENIKLKIDPAFREGTLKAISRVGTVILSGYHLLQRNYPDGSKPEEHIKNTINLIKLWREKNPEIRIHSELGFIANNEIRKSILKLLVPNVNSIGLNEGELADNLYTLRQRDGLEEIRALNAVRIYQGAKKIMKKYHLSRIMIHNREYSLCLISSNYGIKPQSELYAMLFGALLAAALAYTGNFPTIKDAEKALRSGKLRISEKALEEHQKLAAFLENEEGYPKEKFLKEGFTETEPFTVFSPSMLIEPKATVGLGDTLCSASLAAEEALTCREQKRKRK
ncbi:MAG: ADP-dependent glucokinase/phosphofructokinase [Candidatus Jordarchaeaceae archaeon]